MKSIKQIQTERRMSQIRTEASALLQSGWKKTSIIMSLAVKYGDCKEVVRQQVEQAIATEENKITNQ